MIRVSKSADVPKSLAAMKSYNDEDVVGQLRADQHCKCYICERRCVTDFQVEHHRSQKHHEELKYEWTNLFLGCSYCNGKKSDSFDELLNPLDTNIECEIKQELDDLRNKVVFEPTIEQPTRQHTETVQLLERVFNGTKKIRTIREEQFYEYVQQKINSFNGLMYEWLTNPCDETKRPVVEELSIERELLGLKYWVVLSNAHAKEAFKDYIVWNKTR